MEMFRFDGVEGLLGDGQSWNSLAAGRSWFFMFFVLKQRGKSNFTTSSER